MIVIFRNYMCMRIRLKVVVSDWKISFFYKFLLRNYYLLGYFSVIIVYSKDFYLLI